MEKLIETQTKFERSTETKSSDSGLYKICGIAAAIGFILAAGSVCLLARELIESEVFYPVFVSGAVLASANLFLLSFHAIKKNRKHSSTDFAIMHYSRDMYRMSWITELIFESQSNKVGEEICPVDLPPTVLEQFSKSLFVDSASGSDHPVDDLAKLAKRFKRVSITNKGLDAETGE